MKRKTLPRKMLGLMLGLLVLAACRAPRSSPTSTAPPVASEGSPTPGWGGPPAGAAVSAGLVEVNGGQLYYESYGAGPAVVLIHDGLLHREVWDSQVAAFAKEHRVVRYDRRGYGRSPAPSQAFSNVDDLQELLAKLGIERATLVGSSSGGRLALEFALEHPGQVDALILSGAVIDGLGYSAHFMERSIANWSPDLDTLVEHWIDDRYQVAPGNDAARERVRVLLRANRHNLGPEASQFETWQPRVVPERLSAIEVPTLIVVGEADTPDVHTHVGAIESRIRGANREVVRDAGHLVYLEQPEEFNRIALEFLSLIGQRLRRPASELESGFAPVDGAALYYEVMGAGPPLVLIHGGQLDHRMWDEQFELWAREYRVVRYDARGHGLSKGPPGAYRDHDDLHALLKELGVERAHILGLSMGGRIALDFALEYPEQVSSVIAVAPGLSGYEFKTEELEKNREQQRAAYRRLDFGEVVEYFQRAWTDGPRRSPEEVDPDVRGRVRAMALWGVRPGRNMGRVQWPEPPAIERLAEIRAPVLAVVGDEDMPDIEAIVELIVRDVPGAEKVVIPGAGHVVNMEQPGAFNQVVLDFLSKQ